MPLKALLFGSISVVADTSELQRSAYNAAFREAGLDWSWDRAAYRDMLTINGGKKRLRHYAEITDTNLTSEQVDKIHAEKTRLFNERMESEGVRLRPGVERLIKDAKVAGVKLGFVSATSRDNLESVSTASNGALDLSAFDVVTDGSMVETRKPDPAIYELALDRLGVGADEALAIEDTASSAQSPRQAGIVTLGLPNANASEQNWSEVDAVVSSLGENGDNGLALRSPVPLEGAVTLDWLKRLQSTA